MTDPIICDGCDQEIRDGECGCVSIGDMPFNGHDEEDDVIDDILEDMDDEPGDIDSDFDFDAYAGHYEMHHEEYDDGGWGYID